MRVDREVIGASGPLLVLAALQGGATYGYELVQRVNEQAAGVFAWQEGTIYPLLHRMEKEGLVKGEWRKVAGAEGGAGRRKRKYYALTAKGRGRLAAATGQWNAVHAIVAHFTGGRHGAKRDSGGRGSRGGGAAGRGRPAFG